MIRAVLDTNILVSVLIKKGGKPYQILARAKVKYAWLSSAFILQEVASVLTREHTQRRYPNRVTAHRRTTFFNRVQTIAKTVPMKTKVSAIAEDANDDPMMHTVNATIAGRKLKHPSELARNESDRTRGTGRACAESLCPKAAGKNSRRLNLQSSARIEVTVNPFGRRDLQSIFWANGSGQIKSAFKNSTEISRVRRCWWNGVLRRRVKGRSEREDREVNGNATAF
jgi:putative PIN family toxin of toxin-antitoxin system